MGKPDWTKTGAPENPPDVGRAAAADLPAIGIGAPAPLKGRCPHALYDKLNRLTEGVSAEEMNPRMRAMVVGGEGA